MGRNQYGGVRRWIQKCWKWWINCLDDVPTGMWIFLGVLWIVVLLIDVAGNHLFFSLLWVFEGIAAVWCFMLAIFSAVRDSEWYRKKNYERRNRHEKDD